MAENTAIEWTDHTFNPWLGCTKVSPACDNCYAEAWSKRAGSPELWKGSRRRTTEANWRKPLKWNAMHDEFYRLTGRRQRVFCASLADVFDHEVPMEWRRDLLALIRQTPNLDWLLLTKRIGNATRMLAEAMMMLGKYPMREGTEAFPYLWPNVWIGATVVTQKELDRDLPKLARVPAVVRFLSCEPLLEPLTGFWGKCRHCDGSGSIRVPGGGASCPVCFDRTYGGTGHHRFVDWVIVGGESGPGSRPFVLGWAKDIVRECTHGGIATFMKQAGSLPTNREGERCPHITGKGRDMQQWPLELRVREFPVAR